MHFENLRPRFSFSAPVLIPKCNPDCGEGPDDDGCDGKPIEVGRRRFHTAELSAFVGLPTLNEYTAEEKGRRPLAEAPPLSGQAGPARDQCTPAMPFLRIGEISSSTTPTATPVRPMVPNTEP